MTSPDVSTSAQGGTDGVLGDDAAVVPEVEWRQLPRALGLAVSRHQEGHRQHI